MFILLPQKYIFTGDKNELMRERMRCEKAKTNGDKETEVQQKRKSPEEKTGGQKKKKKTQKQTESAKEKEQKAKDREEKQKKKDQDQERQKLMLEARRAQAASRWAANDEVNIVNNPAIATFTPQPIRQTSSSSSCQSSTPLTAGNTPLSSDRTPNTPESTPEESLPANPTLPARPNITKRPTASSKSKGTCSEPRRGLHFQSAVADSSDEEIDEEVEIIPEESETAVSSSDCCKEQRLETKALRKRLEKVHKRLNIACKFLCHIKDKILPGSANKNMMYSFPYAISKLEKIGKRFQVLIHFHPCNPQQQ